MRREVSPVDGSTNEYVSVVADSDITGWLEIYRPWLFFRCMEGKTSAFIVTGMQAHADRIGYGVTSYTNVTLRIDKLPAFEEEMSESTDGKALFFKNPKVLTRTLFGHKKLLFRFTPFNASPTMTTFRITGLQDVINPLREACGWQGVD